MKDDSHFNHILSVDSKLVKSCWWAKPRSFSEFFLTPCVSSTVGLLLVEEVLVVLARDWGKLERVSHDSVELKTTL